MYKEAEVENVHLAFCAGINPEIYINNGTKLGKQLFDFYKDAEEGKTYTVTFEDTTPQENYNSYLIKPKYVFNVMTGGGKSDFVIEVNVILGIVVYKFDMRWKDKKEE